MRIAVAMAQIRVEMGARSENLDRARGAIEQAARLGCDFVVLPECTDLGWTCPDAPQLALPVDEAAAGLAHSRIHVVVGLTERAGDRVYNSAVLIAPTGEILAHHRKINELTIAKDIYSLGTSVGVAETKFGTVAINICADNFPDSLCLAEAQARMGAQLLLSPCAWAVNADHDNSREPYGALWKGAYTTLTRARDLTVAGVSNVGWLTAGPWKGRKCIGCSLTVGRGGEVLAQGPYGENAEAVVPFEVDIQPRGAAYAAP